MPKILVIRFITMVLNFLALGSFAQVVKPIDSNSSGLPSYFLDSVRINKNQLFFDPAKIASINVVKEPIQQAKDFGRIYMKSKNPKDYNFITLKDLEKDYATSVYASTIFMINNEFIKDDLSTYKIDSSYILNVEVLRSCEFEYLKDSIPALTILKINLKSKENMAKASQLHIRGYIDSNDLGRNN